MRHGSTIRVLLAVLVFAALVGCGRDENEASAPSDSASERTDGPPLATPAPNAAPVEASESPPTQAARDERRRQLLETAAKTPAWEPEVAPATDESAADALRRADAALQAGRLDQGDGNALGIYLSVLGSEPDNPAALSGVEKIVQALIAQVESALAERRYGDAKTPMPVLLKLRPGDAAVRQLKLRVDAAQEIAVLLAEAQRLAAEGRLFEPEHDNAAATYAEVLHRDAAHPVALAGIARLESDLVAQATAAAEAGDYVRSDKLLADAARVHPGSGQVQDASTQIVELRQDRAGELLHQAQIAASTGDVARAEQLMGQLEQVSAQSQGIEELRQSIQRARIYGGFAPGQTVTETLGSGGAGPELVVLPAGTFDMGSPSDEADRKKNEGPQHQVVLRRGFALARAEISVAQFRVFVLASGYVTSAERTGRSTIYDERTGRMGERVGTDWQRDHAGFKAQPELPVVHVSWDDAKAYADWLSRETGQSYRLPSEAEFEYALRAGSRHRYPWGDGFPGRLVGNLTGDKDRSATNRFWANAFPDYSDGFWGAAPVRSFKPNTYGVHDSNGNVSEWVEDCWHNSYSRAPGEGSAWVNPGCAERVIRGASWASAPDQARSAFRISATPVTTNARVGFRVARDL